MIRRPVRAIEVKATNDESHIDRPCCLLRKAKRSVELHEFKNMHTREKNSKVVASPQRFIPHLIKPMIIHVFPSQVYGVYRPR